VLLIFFTELKTVFNDRHTHRKTFTDFSYFRYLIDISASIEIIIILNTFQKGGGRKCMATGSEKMSKIYET